MQERMDSRSASSTTCWKMQRGHPTGLVTECAPSKWAGQIFVKRAGFRTTVLDVPSDNSVGTAKARFKWSKARLRKSKRNRDQYHDTRSLGSDGVRREEALLLCGGMCGEGVCMGKPTVVFPAKTVKRRRAVKANRQRRRSHHVPQSAEVPVCAPAPEPDAPATQGDQPAKGEVKPAEARKPEEALVQLQTGLGLNIKLLGHEHPHVADFKYNQSL